MDKLEVRKMIKEEFENSYGKGKIPNNEDLLELVGELRELVVNKDFENKAFNDVLIDKLYFTVFDSRDIVRKEKNKWK
jgi:hypothetical protein